MNDEEPFHVRIQAKNLTGSRYRIVVPLANPASERDLLRMAATSAHAHDDENAEVIAVTVIEVTKQTSLTQDLEFEEHVERQRELLASARDIATDLDIGLRTQAIVRRNAESAIWPSRNLYKMQL